MASRQTKNEKGVQLSLYNNCYADRLKDQL